MAVSAISPINHGIVFIPPLPQAQPLAPQELFATVLQNVVNAPPAMSTAALQEAIAPENLISVLERALLSRFAVDLEGSQVDTVASPIEPGLATELTAASMLPGALRFDTGMFEALNFSSRLTSFFNTLDFMGTDMDREPQIGTTLDFFA